MRPCKRVEIVIERAKSAQLEAVLRDAGARGYTVISHASGSGDRGYRRGDDVTDTDENCVFVVAVEDEELLDRVVAGVRPLLKRVGGVCLVSDAQWLVH